jgi:predicted nicotinamide N-methyase
MSHLEDTKETPWIDAWIRWERDSKEIYVDDDEEEIDNQELHPTDTFSYCFDVGKNEQINITLEGFELECEEVWSSTGLTIWKSSQHLCQYLIDNKEMLEGDCHVLEVGSGLGKCGILAHLLSTKGEGLTYLTDGDTETLKQLRKNVKENVIDDHDNLSCHQLLWGKDTAQEFLTQQSIQNEHLFDVILGSDLIYVTSVISPLFETVKTMIQPESGVFVMAHCARRRGNEVHVDMVLDEAEKQGFTYKVVNEEEDISVFEFRRNLEIIEITA